MPEEKRHTGLTENEVLISRKKYGENVLTQKKRKGFLKQYLSSFSDPIIRILLCVLAVNLLFLFRSSSSLAETIGVAVAILLSTLVSTISSYSSENAFEELQKQASEQTAKVRRAKGVKKINATELVVGDIVYLEAGERIPADGRIISGALKINQSALNGESKEVEKLPLTLLKKIKEGNPEKKNVEINRKDALFKGCIVASGEGVMIVESVGDSTFYGKLAQDVQEEPPASPLKLRLTHLAKILSRIGYIAAILVAFADLFNSFFIDNAFNKTLIRTDLSSLSVVLPRIIHAIELAIAIIVVAVPEGLPMMIAVVLSTNTLKMKRDNVLVKKASGIEAAGGINILFTDKTGTLTKGELYVEKIGLGWGSVFNELDKCPPKIREILVCSAFYNSSSTLDEQGVPIGGNSTDRALLKNASNLYAYKDLHVLYDKYQVITRNSFSSEKKFSSVYISGKNGEKITLLKGAPEKIIEACSYMLGENGEQLPFDKKKVEALRKRFSTNALRVIGVAVASGNKTEDLSLFTFVGLLGISDEIRVEVPSAIKEAGRAGVQVVLITGDHSDTAVAIAKKVGILTGDREELIYTGEELSILSDTELKENLPNLKVVSRALPQDKSRLVRLAQEMGLVVGMTGDGINDAPALKKADVGFALGSGTEIAKEAGDIVITDDNFLSIVKAICYGRTIFKSIRKFVVFQLTMNFCAVGVSLIAPFIGVDNPVTVIQMLWINIIMDTLAGLAFSGESPLPEYMLESPKKREEPVLNRTAIRQILLTGAYTVCLCLAFLKLPIFKILFRYYENPIYHQTAFFALFVFSGLVGAFTARTERINLLSRLKDNKYFAAFILLVAAVQLVIIYFGGNVFRTAGMTIKELVYVLILALTIVPIDILNKISRKVYKTNKKRKRIKLTFSANNSKIKV